MQLRALVVELELTAIDKTVEPVPGIIGATLVTQAVGLLPPKLTLMGQPTAPESVTAYVVPPEPTAIGDADGAGLALNTHCAVAGANVAVTDLSVEMTNGPHVAPLGATGQFDQLEKAYPEPAALPAVSVTDVPDASTALHFAPQLIASKALVTKPVPIFAIVSVTMGAKLAVTVRAAVTLKEHTLVFDVGQFVQLVKRFPDCGVAVNEIFALALTVAVQAAPQLIPAAVAVTVPKPVRLTVTT